MANAVAAKSMHCPAYVKLPSDLSVLQSSGRKFDGVE
jgi:hypothetical protein